jgi:electron transfer flavoprotein beta subunit
MKAKKKAIEETSAGALGVDASPRLSVLAHAPPPARKPGVLVASVAELVDRLQNEAKVL